MFNFEHINILCAWIRHLSEKLWEFKLLESFHYSLSSVSLYHGPHTYTRVKRCHCLNFPRVSVFILEPLDILCAWLGHPWKVMTIWISREIQLFIVKRPNISWASYIHPRQKFWPFEFADSFRCSISSVSIYYAHESDLRVKSYVHLDFSRASVAQFRASR